MRIIQVQTQAEAAGAQRISDLLGEGLRRRGHDVRTVFMYRKTDVYDNDPFAEFIMRDRPHGFADQLRAARSLMAYLKREKPDAVITFQYWGNCFGGIGARMAGIGRIIANQSGAPIKGGLLGIACRIDKLFGTTGVYRHNIVNSHWTQRQFGAYPDGYRKRLRFIEHGVLAAGGPFDKAAARAKFGLPPDIRLVLQTGRLADRKNPQFLMQAMAFLPADVHVAFAGIGPLSDDILTVAEKIGARERLHLLGEVPPADIPELLAAADLFAFPSAFETFGLSVAEAAISGLPVVANDIDVLREVLTLDDGRSAALFAPAEQPEAFASAIGRVLDNPALAADLAAAGRALGDKYAVDKMCAAYEELLGR